MSLFDQLHDFAPWRCRFADYRRVGDMVLPMYGEAGWVLADEWLPYWRGHMTGIEFAY